MSFITFAAMRFRTLKTLGQVYGLQFWLLCLSTVLFFTSFNMIIPELPAYLTSLGGEDYKGLIISLFTLTAAISRPFSGKLADTVGRIPVMIFGSIVCVVCGFLYPMFISVWGFFFIRLLHGFSTGFQPTGISAYVGDLIPFERRGEAMGFLGFFVTLGFAIGPWLGPRLASAFSVEMMFYVSSAAALLSALVIIGMKETLSETQKFSLQLLKVNSQDIFEPRVLAPSLVMMFTGFAFGTILTIIPDFSDHLQVANRGDFFSVYTIAALFVRLAAGKASDRYGRVMILRIATVGLALSMMLIGFSTNKDLFFVAAILFGLASGTTSPTLFAWTIDLSSKHHRGRGMGTMYIALEIGIGSGALMSAWIYNNQAEMFPYAFGLAGLMSLAAFVYLLWKPTGKPVSSS